MKMGYLEIGTKNKKTVKENFRADLFSRTTSLRVIIVLIFAHFGVSARNRAKIYTRENLYE